MICRFPDKVEHQRMFQVVGTTHPIVPQHAGSRSVENQSVGDVSAHRERLENPAALLAPDSN